MQNYYSKIAKEIHALGIPVKYKGFELIIRAVEHIIENDRLKFDKEICAIIAEEKGITKDLVERNIRYAKNKSSLGHLGSSAFVHEIAYRVKNRAEREEHSTDYSYEDIQSIVKHSEELDSALESACKYIAKSTGSCPYEEFGECVGDKKCKDTARCFYKYYRRKASK